MVSPLASRFAVLPIDDDGDTSRRITLKSIRKKQEQFQAQNTGTVPKKPDLKKKQQQQVKKKNDQVQPKQKSKQKNGEGKKPGEDWEQWKKKDAEFVDGSYENDLHQAILLSKLDYEENKEIYGKKLVEEKEGATKKNKKSNKAQPMPLSQFIQMGENEHQDGKNMDNGSSEVNGKPEADPEFFDKVKSEAKKVFKSEQAEEERKAREPFIDEILSVAQYKDRLEKSQDEVTQLKTENEGLRDKLLEVKKRNKKFCDLLVMGEMKDKAQLLLEVDRLQEMNNELNADVKRLVQQLEQEQSKVKSLITGDAKSNHKLLQKRRVRSKTSSETT